MYALRTKNICVKEERMKKKKKKIPLLFVIIIIIDFPCWNLNSWTMKGIEEPDPRVTIMFAFGREFLNKKKLTWNKCGKEEA